MQIAALSIIIDKKLRLNYPKGSLNPMLSVGNVMHMPLSVLRPTNTESIAGLEKW